MADSIWEVHNCPPCPNHGQCQIEGPLEFLKAHEEVVAEVTKSCSEALTQLVVDYGKDVVETLDSNPLKIILALSTSMSLLADSCFTLGYCKGRSHVEIPPAFEKE